MSASSEKTPITFAPNGIDIATAQMVEADLLTPTIIHATVSREYLTVELDDRRILSIPLDWFPRLTHARWDELQLFHLEGNNIHWPMLDEDIGVRGMLLGRRSHESKASLQAWLKSRKAGAPAQTKKGRSD